MKGTGWSWMCKERLIMGTLEIKSFSFPGKKGRGLNGLVSFHKTSANFAVSVNQCFNIRKTGNYWPNRSELLRTFYLSDCILCTKIPESKSTSSFPLDGQCQAHHPGKSTIKVCWISVTGSVDECMLRMGRRTPKSGSLMLWSQQQKVIEQCAHDS